MLLPSAFSCDSSQPRLQSPLFTPPTSPATTQSAIGNLINSCRNLHSFMSSPHHTPNNRQLPSPPLAHVASPLKSRIRKREAKTSTTALNQAELPRYRIKKRVAPPRGLNKRRRSVDDDGHGESENDAFNANVENINIFEESDEKLSSDIFTFKGAESAVRRSPLAAAPSTPKRQRIAPPEVPMGLTREDFHKIGVSPPRQHESASPEGTTVEVTQHGDKWSVEDDSRLVEIVLEKVKNMDLSKEVWEDCVRNLPGKDFKSVSSRWNSLLKTDRIGLQNRRASRRPKLHGTW
ncbi:unnamed protein product [Discula destructiva]